MSDTLLRLRPSVAPERCDYDRLRWRVFARRYGLYRKLSAGTVDECWLAQPLGCYDGRELGTFIRIFPGHRVHDAPIRHLLTSYMHAARHSSIEELHEVGEHEHTPFIITGHWEGAGLHEVAYEAQAVGRTFSPSLVAAIFADGRAGLEALHRAGFCHSKLTPARVRLCIHGPAVLLCSCYPLASQQYELRPVFQDPAQQQQDLRDLARIVSVLAGDQAEAAVEQCLHGVAPDELNEIETRALWKIVITCAERRRGFLTL
jgi:hypothetical protein